MEEMQNVWHFNTTGLNKLNFSEIESVSRFDTLLAGPCLEPCQTSNMELLVKDSILDDWLHFEYIERKCSKQGEFTFTYQDIHSMLVEKKWNFLKHEYVL